VAALIQYLYFDQKLIDFNICLSKILYDSEKKIPVSPIIQNINVFMPTSWPVALASWPIKIIPGAVYTHGLCS